MAAKGTILPNMHSSDAPDQDRDAVRHGDVFAPSNGKAVYKDLSSLIPRLSRRLI